MINKYSDVPLYAQLKEIILEKIQFGEYVENSQIPSEQELCTLFNISRPTVRQAISELTNSGYLKKEKGRGTFVCGESTTTQFKNYSGFQDSILDAETYHNKKIISTKILECSCIEKDILNSFEAIQNNYSHIAEIKYNLIANNEIIALVTSYIPTSLFPTIIDDVTENKKGQDILLGRYPLVPSKVKSCLEVAFCEIQDAANLYVQSGSPIIKISNQIFSKNGALVEYSICKYRIDKCQFLYETTK